MYCLYNVLWHNNSHSHQHKTVRNKEMKGSYSRQKVTFHTLKV